MSGLFDLNMMGMDDLLDSNIYSESGLMDRVIKHTEVSIPIPGGLNERPTSRPKGETPLNFPASSEITADAYNKAFSRLKQSFKEGLEIMEILENAIIVDDDYMDLDVF